MSKKPSSSGRKSFRFLAGAVALAALISLGSPGTSQASTTANAKIVNQVVVTYRDATGVGTTFTKKADVSVTVWIVRANLTVSPLTSLKVNAGLTATYNQYEITSNANGSDIYKITNTFSGSTNLDNTEEATFTIYRGNDAGTLSPAENGSINHMTPQTINVPIGGAIATGSTSGTLYFPGGTVDSNIPLYAIVTVEGDPNLYRVSARYDGLAPSAASGSYVAETPGSITLEAYPSGAPAPAFGSDLARGKLVSERVFLRVSVSGTITGALGDSSPDGTATHVITTSDSLGGFTSGTATNTTTFYGSSLAVTKSIYDCGTSNVASDACTLKNGGNVLPGHILEYVVTVHNTGHGPATLVQVADAVPAYTTLLTYADSGLPVPLTSPNTFAKITTGASTDLPNLDIDIPANGGGTPGIATGKIAIVGTNPTIAYEGNSLTFFLGTSSTTSVGGTLNAGSGATPTPANAPTYTIKYRVKVN